MAKGPWFGRNAGASHWLWLALVIIALDRFTKHLVVTHLAQFQQIVVLPMLDFMHLQNTGAAFSFLSDASGWQRWAFTALGIVVSLGIVVWLRRLPGRGRHVLAAGLSLVLGGALGNVIDRLAYGYVIDFIRVHYANWYFPAFNIADSAITIGAILLLIDSAFDLGGGKARASKRSSSPPDL